MMDFPSWKPERINRLSASDLKEALGVAEIVGVYKNRDLLVELNREEDVINADPDFTCLKKMGEKVIITAPGKSKDVDFVSRFFAPIAGIDEDPVTGSAHSQLIPFWSGKIRKGKNDRASVVKAWRRSPLSEYGRAGTDGRELCVLYERQSGLVELVGDY